MKPERPDSNVRDYCRDLAIQTVQELLQLALVTCHPDVESVNLVFRFVTSQLEYRRNMRNSARAETDELVAVVLSQIFRFEDCPNQSNQQISTFCLLKTDDCYHYTIGRDSRKRVAAIASAVTSAMSTASAWLSGR